EVGEEWLSDFDCDRVDCEEPAVSGDAGAGVCRQGLIRRRGIPMGRAADIERFVAALDPTLEPFGFRRRKKAQEWSRKYDHQNRDYIHINFGLAVVNPSIAVEYLDLRAIVPHQFGNFGSFAMLEPLVPRRPRYDFDTNTPELAKDMTE